MNETFADCRLWLQPGARVRRVIFLSLAQIIRFRFLVCIMWPSIIRSTGSSAWHYAENVKTRSRKFLLAVILIRYMKNSVFLVLHHLSVLLSFFAEAKYG